MTWLRSCPVYSFFSLFSLSMYVYVYVALTRVHEDVFVHMLERMHTLLTLSSILYERRRCICPPPSLPLTPAAFILLLSVSVRERERVVTYRTWQCRLLLLGCQCISPESVERVLFLCFVSPFVDIVVCTIVFFIRISLYRFRCVYIFSRTSLFVCDMLCPSSSSSSSLHCHPLSLSVSVSCGRQSHWRESGGIEGREPHTSHHF